MGTFWRNALLTLVVAGPLLASFVKVINYYPVPVWSLFSERRELAAGHTYFVLRGQRADGSWRDIPPVRIISALNGRHFMFATYTAANQPFRVESPHPNNVRFLERAGGFDQLPAGARMNDLLRALGTIHNGRLPPDSPERLMKIRIEERRWSGGHYGDYEGLLSVWEIEL